MFAITLNELNYIDSYSDKYRTPDSVLVEDLPDADPDKLKCYQYIEGEFVFDAGKYEYMKSKKTEEERIEATICEIATLKESLYASDYQIIKCYEYSLINLEMPYDVEALHAERQALRDKINALESTIN